MSERTISRTVTFRSSFTLPGMTEPHAPGTFEVITDEEQLDVMWDARRSSTRVMLVYPERVEAFPVSASGLEEAIAQDQQRWFIGVGKNKAGAIGDRIIGPTENTRTHCDETRGGVSH